MKYNKILALTPALLLAACGGGDKQTLKEVVAPGSTIYSFPADGQSEVSPKADIVLRFSHAITDEELTDKIRINDGSSDVPFSVTLIDGGRSLKLSPADNLDLATDYTITFDGNLQAEGGRMVPTPNAFGAEGIQFSTRAGMTGIVGLDSLSAGFAVDEMIPSADGFFQPMDFSTFRLRLTQPVHPEWQEMGGSISLQDANGETVPASVLVKGRFVTIDPCTTEAKSECGLDGDALSPDTRYSVVLANLPSLAGETLNYSAEFTPKDTSPTIVLFQEAIDSGLLAGQSQADAERSVLNGEIINGVTLNSVLMGTAGPSQTTGGLYAELAYAPSFPGDEPVPLRVPKGSLLLSSSLELNINGSVPIINPETNSIQETGQVKVTMLSDATGYLYPNPYSDSDEAPRHVKLFMDVAMNAEEAQPNASLSQDLLGVELSGIAIVKDGVLTIDALGIVEPDLLGQELADSTLAFRIEADTNAEVQLDALDTRTADTSGPQLLSWMPGPDEAIPGNRDQMHRPGDPIVLNFDEALDGDSLAAGFTLLADGTEVPSEDLRRKLDGTVVALNPVGGLQHGVDYALQINSALTDLAGNGATSQTLSFALPTIKDGSEAPFVSPIALTTYPGYPCVSENLDLANGSHGTCVDDAPGGTVRDQLPVTTLPEDRPIIVQFSQSMDLDTINSDSFVVEKIANPASPGAVGNEERVSGRLELTNQRARFYPDSAWETDTLYRYTLRSAVDGDCSAGTLVCSEDGMPLQTDLLVDPSDVGGPDLSIYFTGTEPTTSVFTQLRNFPVRDANSNYVIDCGTPGGTDCLEPFTHETDGDGGFLPTANAGRLMVVDSDGDGVGDSSAGDARVGCSPDGADCPTNKFIYQTYGLDTEVVGPAFDEDGNTIGVRVLLYPTQLATTSATVVVSASLLLGSDINSATGTQILRMTYGEPTEDNPLGLVEGIISEGPDGRPIFSATADLTLDAPNLSGVSSHDVYSKPVQLKLSGPITFFDDGRMQIEERNVEAEDITVNAVAFGVDVEIPLRIPAEGVYLNFITNPIKEIPEQY
ncbi:MAG: Ig-like domain-containing protein [Marinobacter sp.]|uniref:Ig-like domain-containing protein n=1 Tax=Marinobacter sp. TaxID=50741 RepID=UPI00299E285A|nr:Ig-like domain-containing protein [Marinobacter sp.]MDX1755109.1 Ig-like domain-containing protein [Marinobacter sp.]